MSVKSGKSFGVIFLAAMLLLLLCDSSRATLIICLYHDHALYLASDSLVTQKGTNRLSSKKIFPVGNSCCVSIANNYGGFTRDPRTGEVSIIYFPKKLDSVCSNSVLATFPIQRVATNVIGEFKPNYDKYVSQRLDKLTDEDIATRLCFWGYDKAKRTFFGFTCLFDGTNNTALVSNFQRDQKNNEGHLSFQGEDKFLSGLLQSQDENLLKLTSEAFKKTCVDFKAQNAISDERIVNLLLEMFSLHKKYAPVFSSDKGWIDEPYIVYKMTEEKTVKIH